MVNRIIRDDPSKGDMHNRQAVSFPLFWEALQDYDMWPVYLLGLTWSVPQTPSQSYITLIIGSLGFNTFQTNLLTIPAYALFIFQLIAWTWVSERINNRFLIVLVCQIWMLPLLIALEVLPGGQAYAWSRYVLNLMLVGFPYVHAIIGKYTRRSYNPYHRGAAVRAIQLTIAPSRPRLPQRRLRADPHRRHGALQHVRAGRQHHRLERKPHRLSLASLFPPSHLNPLSPALPPLPFLLPCSAPNRPSQQIYRTPDAPYYYTGNKVLIGLTAWNIVLIVAAKAYYSWRNRVREKKWDAMTRAEREAYLVRFAAGEEDGDGHRDSVGSGRATGRKQKGGNKRLDFRFVH